MPRDSCREYARLEAEAQAVLRKIGEITGAQRKTIEDDNAAEFTRLDRELELAIGHKERVIGALREHAADHGCQRAFLPEL